MFSVYVSIGAAILTGLVVALRYGVFAAIFTGLFLGGVVFFLLSRHFLGKLQGVTQAATKHLESQRWDVAIQTLESGFPFARWMVLGEAQLKGQLGYIHYVRKNFDKAFPLLEKSFSRDSMAQALLAACHYRRKEVDKAYKVLERAIKFNGKTPILWGLYAWIADEQNDVPKALEVLGRGNRELPEDEAIKSNMLALQNKKKLKMSKFGDLWYQFHFELPPQRVLQAHQPPFAALRRRG